MAQSVVQEKIQRYEKYAKDAKDAIAELTDIRSNLAKYTRKIVDKRFFIQHYTISNEYREWTKYEIRASDYSFQGTYNIRVGKNRQEYVELESRETAHVMARIDDKIQRLQESILRYEEELKNLNALDEKALVLDLIAVWEKHGRPEVWTKILDSYEVKYPKED